MRRILPCRLSDAQIANRAKLAAALEAECRRLEEEKKRLIDESKEKIESVKDRITGLMAEIREEAEFIEVECEWRTKFDLNLKELIRLDTGIVVDTAALTAEERQGDLFLVGSQVG